MLLALLWLAGLLAQLPRTLRQWAQTRTLLRESMPLTDPAMQALCAREATLLGLRRCPRLRVSPAITSPQVIGLRQPTVLLPADQALTPAESHLALAHELAHLQRGDLWLGWIPVIAQRLFFFHPLVAWATREYALTREAACDAQVLAQPGTEPQTYARLLLRLGVAHPMHSGLAGASSSFRTLKRRLIMLQRTEISPRQGRFGWLLVVLIALAGTLPYRVTAADTSGTGKNAPASSVQTLPPAPPPPPAPMPPRPPLPAVASPPPVPPAPPAPPAPAADSDGFSAHHISIDTSTNARDGFALLDGDSITITGNDSDLATAKRLHRTNDPMLWFRRGDKAWLIRDPAMLKRARAIYQPLTELASQQGRLAGRQGEFAGRQAGLAARGSAFAQQQAELAEQQARLAQETAGRSRAEPALETRSRALEAQQAELDRRQDVMRKALDEQQQALEQKQATLDRQQAAMDKRQQEAEARAEREIRKLLDEALAKGVAQSVSAH